MIDLADPRTHGWRQGVLLPTTLNGLELNRPGSLITIRDGDLLVIVTQDCDLIHHSFEEEPFFEALIARKIDETGVDQNKLHGKNPRRIVFELAFPDSVNWYEAAIIEKVILNRRLLVVGLTEYTSVDSATLSVLRRWLGKRYNRPAFPSAFNKRVGSVQDKLTQKLKKKGQLITAVLLDLDTMEELPADRPYTMSLYLLMSSSDYGEESHRRDALSVLASAQEAFLRCEGIEIENAQVVTEDEITVAAMRRLKSWDYANYLSQRPGHASSALL